MLRENEASPGPRRPMLGDRDALLRAVLESPYDDAPRLILADWLDEHEEPDRAEFIRFQTGLAMRERDAGHTLLFSCKCKTCVSSISVLRRATDLLDANRQWFRVDGFGESVGVGEDDPLAWWSFVDSRGVRVGMTGTPSRGFLSAIAIDTQVFMDFAPTLFTTHPVTSVRLTDRTHGRDNDPPYGHYWSRGPYEFDVDDEDPRSLPYYLFNLLPADALGRVAPIYNYANYPSGEAANAALSLACVGYGRLLAGLPPLS